MCSTDDKSALVQVLAWGRTGAKPLPEPIMFKISWCHTGHNELSKIGDSMGALCIDMFKCRLRVRMRTQVWEKRDSGKELFSRILYNPSTTQGHNNFHVANDNFIIKRNLVNTSKWWEIFMIWCIMSPEIISCIRPANEWRCYNVTSSLIGWMHTQNDPCGIWC